MNRPPIVIDLTPGAVPQHFLQYPIPQVAQLGIQEHLTHLREHGILIECQLPWNTPLLPVKKLGGGYQPVQDL